MSIENWTAAQNSSFSHQMDQPVTLGPIYSDSWRRDPKHLLFNLARYKFVSKMLPRYTSIAEVGAGDGFGAEIVAAATCSLVALYDLSPLNDNIKPHDITTGPLPHKYSNIYALDLLEHLPNGKQFFKNITDSLYIHGRLIVGTPSLESQAYASEPSHLLHINCFSGEALQELASQYFHHVFMFSMNDEVVHTGFMPMAHYLWAICAEPR